MSSLVHVVKATSFADPKDVARFRACKIQGHSDGYCFARGDNGKGYWGDSTVEGSGPSCALPPEDLEEKWGSLSHAQGKPVLVVRQNGLGNTVESVVALVKDTMPRRKNIHNGAGIDLNPDAVRALGWQPPLGETVSWSWA